MNLTELICDYRCWFDHGWHTDDPLDVHIRHIILNCVEQYTCIEYSHHFRPDGKSEKDINLQHERRKSCNFQLLNLIYLNYTKGFSSARPIETAKKN